MTSLFDCTYDTREKALVLLVILFFCIIILWLPSNAGYSWNYFWQHTRKKACLNFKVLTLYAMQRINLFLPQDFILGWHYPHCFLKLQQNSNLIKIMDLLRYLRSD